MVQFRLPGPLEARDGKRRVELGRAKRRVLLAVLLVHANDVVSLDRFTAAWGGLRADAGFRHCDGVGCHIRDRAAIVVPLGLTLLTSAFPAGRQGSVAGIWGGVVGVVVAAGSPLHC